MEFLRNCLAIVMLLSVAGVTGQPGRPSPKWRALVKRLDDQNARLLEQNDKIQKLWSGLEQMCNALAMNTVTQAPPVETTTMSMSTTVPPLTTHILDTSVGTPAANVQMSLYIQNANSGFDFLEGCSTDNDGRGSFLKGSTWQTGVYKLHFETDLYFQQNNKEGFYPYVDVVFKITDPGQHYHVPLLLSPFGYTTYRGS